MNNKWVLLFLVHASTKQTRGHVKELFKILESTAYNEQVKVLVLYSGLQNSVKRGYRNQVTLRQITPHEKTGKLFLKEVVPTYGIIDIGDDKKLDEIFVMVRATWPSERFMLFTWDHGSGFGIFKTDPRERDERVHKTPVNFEMAIMKNDVAIPASLPAEALDFKIVNNKQEVPVAQGTPMPHPKKIIKKKLTTSMLTNDELGKIIKFNSGAKKVDLLIMMNCAMQMIETGYALHDAVEYLIAPETCIFWAGYNYRAIINELCGNPDIPTESIGKYAIKTIKAYYQNTPSKQYFDDLVVSMVKPGKAVEIREELDAIATILNGMLATSLPAIKKARQSCEDVTEKFVAGVPYQYIDLLGCVAMLATTTKQIPVDGMRHAINEYVVATIKGDNYNKMLRKKHNIGQVNGCSIYFPMGAAQADADLYYDWFYKAGLHQTAFARDGQWKGFLVNYFKHDRKKNAGNNL